MGLAVLPARLKGELEAVRYTEQEIGEVFAAVLEDAGVFKRTEAGKAAFMRFIDYITVDYRK